MKRAGTAAVCGALACALGVGTAAAYLTGSVSTNNPFRLSTDLKIELTEPSFAADEAKAVKPAQTVAKDPIITNTGSMDAYIAADVKIPLFTGDVLSDGTVSSVKDQELFTYAVNDGWTLKGTPKVEGGFKTYSYVYSSPIAPSWKTSSIFDSVTLANLTQDVGITDTSIDITAYAIQAEGFANSLDANSAYDLQAQAKVTVGA